MRLKYLENDIVGSHHRFEHSRHASARGHTQTRDQYTEHVEFVALPAVDLRVSQWTSVSKDDRLLTELLAAFWTLDNMVEPSLYRPFFEEDMSNNNTTFCSPFLVNALLALSCVS